MPIWPGGAFRYFRVIARANCPTILGAREVGPGVVLWSCHVVCAVGCLTFLITLSEEEYKRRISREALFEI